MLRHTTRIKTAFASGCFVLHLPSTLGAFFYSGSILLLSIYETQEKSAEELRTEQEHTPFPTNPLTPAQAAYARDFHAIAGADDPMVKSYEITTGVRGFATHTRVLVDGRPFAYQWHCWLPDSVRDLGARGSWMAINPSTGRSRRL